MTLSAYDYSIVYKPGDSNSNADVLSCLPLPDKPVNVPVPGETILLLDTLSKPMTAKQVKCLTDRDPLLSSVRRFTQQGWRYPKDESLKPFYNRKEELSVQDGIVLWGSRVIVPQSGRASVLEVLHQGHLGICRMKSLARSTVWWPGIHKDLETVVKDCH